MALGDRSPSRSTFRIATVGRALKATSVCFAKISARPFADYAQIELAVESFTPAELAEASGPRLPKGVEIELWWQDEARIGQKG